MRIEVDVACWHDWELRHKDSVAPDEVAIPSHHGPDLRMVQVLRDEPNTTFIDIPDQDVDRMVADREEASRLARQGYTAVHEGGAQHGQQVVVAPRHLPTKTLNQLVAEHIGQTVMPYHAPAEHIRRVRVAESSLDPADHARLERYLNRQLVMDEDDGGEAAPTSAEEPAG